MFRRRSTNTVGQFDFYYGSRPNGWMLVLRIARPGQGDVYVDDGSPPADQWLHVFADYNTSYYANIYIKETGARYSSYGVVPLTATTDPLYIGARGDQGTLGDVRNVFNGDIRWFILWDNSGVATSELIQRFRDIVEKKIIYVDGVVMFFDPTFISGAYYLDVVGGYSAISSDVTRVEDADKWLWLLKGRYGDEYLHIGWLDQLPVPDGGGVRIVIVYGGYAYEFWFDKDDIVSGEYLIDLVELFGTSTLTGATIKVQVWSERPSVLPVEVTTSTVVVTVTETETATVTETETVTTTIGMETVTETKTVTETTTKTVTTTTTETKTTTKTTTIIRTLPPPQFELVLENVDISGGDAVAPHLYEWKFIGDSGRYINISHSSAYVLPYLGYAIALKMDSEATQFLLYKLDLFQLYYQWDPGAGRYGYVACYWRGGYTGASPNVWLTQGIRRAVPNQWQYIFGEYNATTYAHVCQYNASLASPVCEASEPQNAPLTTTGATNPLYIGVRIGDPWNRAPLPYSGRVAWFIMWDASEVTTSTSLSRFLSMINNKVVYMGNAKVFVDPTFFDGSKFVDVAGNDNHASPYGADAASFRVASSERWLWLLKELYNDNKLHIKFVPPDTTRVVILYNGQEYEFWVTGTPNAAGLVEDFTIDLQQVFGSTQLTGAIIRIEFGVQRPVGTGVTTTVTVQQPVPVPTTITKTYTVLVPTVVTSTVTSPVPTTITATVATPVTVVTTIQIPATTVVVPTTVVTTVRVTDVRTETRTVTSPVPTTVPTTVVTTVRVTDVRTEAATQTLTEVVERTVERTVVSPTTVVSPSTIVSTVPTTVVSSVPTTVTERITDWLTIGVVGILMLAVGAGLAWLLLMRRGKS